jgi:uncharacterized protein (DUF433 family)
MTLTESKIDWASLTAVDKAAVIEILLASLSSGSLGIKKTPGVCGGDACVGNTRIPVWSLVNYRHLGANDGRILQDFPHLSAADLVNAWAYADAYPEEIESAIARNEAA